NNGRFAVRVFNDDEQIALTMMPCRFIFQAGQRYACGRAEEAFNLDNEGFVAFLRPKVESVPAPLVVIDNLPACGGENFSDEKFGFRARVFLWRRRWSQKLIRRFSFGNPKSRGCSNGRP